MALTHKRFTLSDYITIGLLVLSASGLYYRQEAKTNLLDSKVSEVQKSLEKNNPEVIQVDINYIKRDIQSLDAKFDNLIQKLDEKK